MPPFTLHPDMKKTIATPVWKFVPTAVELNNARFLSHYCRNPPPLELLNLLTSPTMYKLFCPGFLNTASIAIFPSAWHN